jgi:hypothetical protein
VTATTATTVLEGMECGSVVMILGRRSCARGRGSAGATLSERTSHRT